MLVRFFEDQMFQNCNCFTVKTSTRWQVFSIMINESILQTHVSTHTLNQETTFMALRAENLFDRSKTPLLQLLQETSATDVSYVIWHELHVQQ